MSTIKINVIIEAYASRAYRESKGRQDVSVGREYLYLKVIPARHSRLVSLHFLSALQYIWVKISGRDLFLLCNWPTSCGKGARVSKNSAFRLFFVLFCYWTGQYPVSSCMVLSPETIVNSVSSGPIPSYARPSAGVRALIMLIVRPATVIVAGTTPPATDNLGGFEGVPVPSYL